MENNLKITKIKLINQGFNSMEGHYWYYQVFFRIYNEEHTKYCHYFFVVNFTGEDFDEFRYDEENDSYISYGYTPEDYAEELAAAFVDSFDFTFKNHSELLDACNETIRKYNRRISNFY